MMAKMIHTKAGYTTKEEAKIIGDLDRELKRKKKCLNRPKTVRK